MNTISIETYPPEYARSKVVADSIILSNPNTNEIITIVKNVVIDIPTSTGLYPLRYIGINTFHIINIVIAKLSIARTPVLPATKIKKIAIIMMHRYLCYHGIHQIILNQHHVRMFQLLHLFHCMSSHLLQVM